MELLPRPLVTPQPLTLTQVITMTTIITPIITTIMELLLECAKLTKTAIMDKVFIKLINRLLSMGMVLSE